MKEGILLIKTHHLLMFGMRLSAEENQSGKIPVDECVQQNTQSILSVAKRNLLHSLQHFLLPWYKSPDAE